MDWIMRRRWLLLICAAAIMAVVAVFALRKGGHEVLVSQAQRGDLVLRIAASGLVEARSADLSFKGSGRLTALYAAEGDTVGGGDLLARIDPISSLGTATAGQDVIQAPHDGTVVQVYVRRGAVVQPGQGVLRFVASSGTWVTGFIDSEDAPYMRRGQTYRCRAGGYLSRPYDIVVHSVGREAVARMDIPGSSRQVRVRFDVADPSFDVPAGTEVDIDGEALMCTDALLVPTAAVVREGPSDHVWTVVDGEARRVSVGLGPNNFEMAQILQGLEPGDSVVVRGKENLTQGTAVRPRPLPDTSRSGSGGE